VVGDLAADVGVVDDHPSATHHVAAHWGLHGDVDAFLDEFTRNGAIKVETSANRPGGRE
jgi:hypothetical protein